MLVIGNGESRKDIDLDKHIDTKIGCNAIHRDYRVDHLICVDRRMVQQAVDANVNETSIVYTRTDWIDAYRSNQKIRTVPKLLEEGNERWDEPFQWGSGPYAVLLGAKLSKEVKLIGFDLHSKTKTVNNVYKDTIGYDASTKNAVDPRYWIHQIGQVFKWYPKRKFTIYQLDNWQIPQNWKLANVSVDYIDNL
jgi:kynurenine formamidase